MVDDYRARMTAAVAARLNILLDEDDPAFVIVELNRLMLEQAIRELLQAFRAMETRLANFPPPAPPVGAAFAEDIAKSISASVLADLRARTLTQQRAASPSRPKLSWQERLSNLALATALAAALIFSALTLSQILHVR